MFVHTKHAQRAYAILFLSCTLLLTTLLVGCDSAEEESTPTLPSSWLAMRKGDLVTADYHARNPFDSIGIRHNQILHHVIASMHPWDTLDVSHMLGRSQTAVCDWSVSRLGMSQDESMGLVQSAYALRTDSSARQRLASIDGNGMTERERHYLRRLGELLCEEDRFEDTDRKLAELERDILAESWPQGDSTEVLPRIAISIARHSYAYWKRMMCTARSLPDADGTLSKTATDLLIITNSETKIIVAADVFAGISAAKAVSGLGILTTLQVGLVSAGTVSAAVAIIVYADEIVSSLNKLLPWNG